MRLFGSARPQRHMLDLNLEPSMSVSSVRQLSPEDNGWRVVQHHGSIEVKFETKGSGFLSSTCGIADVYFLGVLYKEEITVQGFQVFDDNLVEIDLWIQPLKLVQSPQILILQKKRLNWWIYWNKYYIFNSIGFHHFIRLFLTVS